MSVNPWLICGHASSRKREGVLSGSIQRRMAVRVGTVPGKSSAAWFRRRGAAMGRGMKSGAACVSSMTICSGVGSGTRI